MALLLNRLQGGLDGHGWPTDDPGLSRAQIALKCRRCSTPAAMTSALLMAFPGPRPATRCAEQEKRNLADGRVGKRIYDALKAK